MTHRYTISKPSDSQTRPLRFCIFSVAFLFVIFVLMASSTSSSMTLNHVWIGTKGRDRWLTVIRMSSHELSKSSLRLAVLYVSYVFESRSVKGLWWNCKSLFVMTVWWNQCMPHIELDRRIRFDPKPRLGGDLWGSLWRSTGSNASPLARSCEFSNVALCVASVVSQCHICLSNFVQSRSCWTSCHILDLGASCLSMLPNSVFLLREDKIRKAESVMLIRKNMQQIATVTK